MAHPLLCIKYIYTHTHKKTTAVICTFCSKISTDFSEVINFIKNLRTILYFFSKQRLNKS